MIDRNSIEQNNYIFDIVILIKMERVIDILLSKKKKDKLRDISWELYDVVSIQSKKKEIKKLKIYILNTPCYGFGDVIFALKLKNYLVDWYNCSVKILTTMPHYFSQLGEKKNIYELKGGKSKQCRRLRNLKLKNRLPIPDLIFIAPLISDFKMDRNDVKSLIPSSNLTNTFFFSEYNHSERNMDFNTGIGKNKVGLFLTNMNNIKKKKLVKTKYCVCYIADMGRSFNCFLSFFNMVCKKYSKNKHFGIVIQDWLVDDILKKKSKLKNDYFSNVILVTKENDEVIFESHPLKGVNRTFSKKKEDKNTKTFYLYANIFPISNQDMLSLIKYSEKDILVTGDQSISDVLSCCSSKNIFYQIVDWKTTFAKQLAKELPNKYLSSRKTSCGSIQATSYVSNYKKFVEKWDFRKLGKPKLDSIMLYTVNKKKDKELREIDELIQTKKSLKSIKNELRDSH